MAAQSLAAEVAGRGKRARAHPQSVLSKQQLEQQLTTTTTTQ